MAGLQVVQKEKGDRLLSEEERDLGSEYECELMIEALRKELDMVRVSQACSHEKEAPGYSSHFANLQDQLAFLTHQLDAEEQQQSPPLPRPPTRRYLDGHHAHCYLSTVLYGFLCRSLKSESLPVQTPRQLSPSVASKVSCQ